MGALFEGWFLPAQRTRNGGSCWYLGEAGSESRKGLLRAQVPPWIKKGGCKQLFVQKTESVFKTQGSSDSKYIVSWALEPAHRFPGSVLGMGQSAECSIFRAKLKVPRPQLTPRNRSMLPSSALGNLKNETASCQRGEPGMGSLLLGAPGATLQTRRHTGLNRVEKTQGLISTLRIPPSSAEVSRGHGVICPEVTHGDCGV